MASLRIVVAGVTGWTGSALAQGIANDPSLTLVAGVSRKQAGSTVPNTSAPIFATVKEALELKPDVLVDYTHPSTVKQHVFEAIEANVSVIIGTSGLNGNDFEEIKQKVSSTDVGVIASGNYSLTASLLKQFSLMAAKYIDTFEIIDYASFKKVDVPSGTANELAETLSTITKPRIGVEIDNIHGPKEARGANVQGVQVHSVRLPSFILSCESLFGLPDERLTIRHDAGSSAAPYVAGTILAIKKVQEKRGQVVRGLNTLLFGNTTRTECFVQTFEAMQQNTSIFSVENNKRKAPDEGWESRDHYFDVKKQRLVKQFEQARSTDKPQIFKGVTIHVDGRTKPTNVELKEIMAQFGGQYEQYYNTNVTHYICTNLAESKLKQFANTKDPPHFVQPSWITDCIQAGTLLSTKDYFVANRNTNNKSITSLLGSERVGLKEYQKNSRLHTIGTYKSKHEHEDTIDEDVGEFMSKFIVHIDMDCFFASVAMRDDPSLCTKPIAVSHATMGGSGDISSCNYVARQFGVKASMWTGQAKQICPELVIVPYELQKYESIADTMNNILFEMCGDKRFVRVTSIDEAYLDLTTHCNNESRMAEEMVKRIRDKILSETGCPCSAGISHNTLLAKLATRCAKPNGQYYLNNDENTVKQFFIDKQISLRDIPGIGRKKHNKLSEVYGKIEYVHEVWIISKESLQTTFGPKIGESIYNNCRGIPTPVPVTTIDKQSVSVEMNYAIRYTRTQEALDQLDEIAQQISEKLKKKKFRTKLITVKGKQRAPDAPVETKKFMGHGKCTNFTKAIACDATDDVTIISKYAKQVYTSLNVPIEDLRGIGVTASKFVESSGGSTMQATSLSQYFRKSGSEEEPKRATEKTPISPLAVMPTFSQIDQNVLQELPEEIKNEVLQQVTPKKKSTLRIIKRPKKKDVPPPVKITEMLNAVPIMNEAQKEELENIKNNISSIDYNVVKELPTKIQMEILNEKISKRKKQEKQEKEKEEVIIKKKKKDEMMMYKSSHAKIEQMKSCVTEWMIIDVTEDGDVYMELLLQFVNQLFCGEKDMEGGVRFLKMIRRMVLNRGNQSWKELFDRLLRNVNDQVLPMSGLCDVAETRIAVDFLDAASL